MSNKVSTPTPTFVVPDGVVPPEFWPRKIFAVPPTLKGGPPKASAAQVAKPEASNLMT